MDERTFGVELEFNTDKQGGIDFVRSVWAHSLGADSRWCRAGWLADGSQIEVNGPVMKGSDDMEELKAAVQALADAGCKVNRADGLHVHHGAPELVEDSSKAVKVYRAWLNNQDLIWHFVAGRRNGSFVCVDASEYNLDTISASDYGYLDRYHNLNYNSLGEHGTVEFRQHEGTLRPEKVEAWIEFGKAFLTKALEAPEPVRSYARPDTLLKGIAVPEHCQAVLLNNVKERDPDEETACEDDFYNPHTGGWV